MLLVGVVVAMLSVVVACQKSNKNDGRVVGPKDVDTTKNEWVYNYDTVGALSSTIWKAFIDTREAYIWQIYLSPVKDIEFDEVFDFSPVKIIVPVDFPLDGTLVRFADDSSIRVEYDPVWWDATNASDGFVSATYDYRTNIFEITFHTSGRLKGHYRGSLDIVE